MIELQHMLNSETITQYDDSSNEEYKKTLLCQNHK